MTEPLTVRTVGIVGAGLMGTGIAEAAAVAGVPTILVKATPGDHPASTPDSLGEARRRIERSLVRSVERGRLTAEQRDEALFRIEVTAHREALVEADLVIESVVENLAQKRALLADLRRYVGPRAIFASNTSTLRIADLARGLECERRTVGLHFFSPVPAMKLVELSCLAETDPAVAAAAVAFVERLGKTVVRVPDVTGFVVNRLLVPYLLGAIAAYESGFDGHLDPATIDLAMRLGCGHPLGPLALSDLIGLDIVFAMATLLFADTGDVRYRPPDALRRLVEAGHLGKKARLGLYDYAVDPPRANPAVRAARVARRAA